MADSTVIVENLEDINISIDIPQPLEVLVYMSDLDRKIYLAGCALNAHIQRHTGFEDHGEGSYPYNRVAGYCAIWADAVLAACGAGGSAASGGSGGSSSGSGSSSSSSGSSGGFGCGASVVSSSGSGSSGSCTANPSGGVPPYTYEWSNGETTKTISGLSSGTYTVTCTDSAGSVATASCTVN